MAAFPADHGRRGRRFRARLGAAGIAAALNALAVLPAAAQTGAPVSLLAPAKPPAAQAGLSAPAAQTAPQPAPVGTLPTTDPRNVVVQREIVPAYSTDSIGLLEANQGGFRADLWAGTSTGAVRALLGRLPGSTPSATLRSVARRLLVTAADAPKGETPAGGPSLLELRVKALLALGLANDAAALAGAAPASARGPVLSRDRIDALLLAGKTTDACADLASLADDSDDSGMAEARVLCDFTSGNAQGGNFGLDLLRDRKPRDPVFIAAAEALSGVPPGKGLQGSLRDPGAVQLAALQAAKLPLPPDMAATARPAVVRALALSPSTPLDLRLEAGVRAEGMGLVDTQTLRQVMDSVQFTAGDLTTPLASSGGMTPARALALLLRATSGTADPIVDVVAKAMDIAAKNGCTATAARLFAPVAASVAAQPALAGFAPVAARILLIAGQPQAAQPWVALASGDSRQAGALWPLARLWGVGDASPAAAAAWRGSVDPRRAVLALGLIGAAGQPVSDDDMAALLGVKRDGEGMGPALARMLTGAARDKRVGATVLAALAAMDGAALDKVDPDTAARVVSGLAAVGLADDGRRLATEIMLANGM